MVRKRLIRNHSDLVHRIFMDTFGKEYSLLTYCLGEYLFNMSKEVLYDMKDWMKGKIDKYKLNNLVSKYKTDGTIFVKDKDSLVGFRIVIYEHYSRMITDKKLKVLTIYDLFKFLELGIPIKLVLLSKYTVPKEKLHVRDDFGYWHDIEQPPLDEKVICEKLNNVSDIINNNPKISDETGIDLGIVILYAPIGKEREAFFKALDCYLKSEITSTKLKRTLYRAFYLMADCYIDDEAEFKEVIRMLREKVTPEMEEEMDTFIQVIEEKDIAIEEKDKALSENAKEIEEKDIAIEEKDKALSENAKEIEEKDNQIKALTEEKDKNDENNQEIRKKLEDIDSECSDGKIKTMIQNVLVLL